jgi:hypothetical protein
MSRQIVVRAAGSSLPRRWACLASFFSLLVSCSPPATLAQIPGETPDAFHWVQAASDPKLWEEILQKFNEELTPDQATPEKNTLDVYGYKYLQKVATFGHSALVIVGHRPAKAVSKDNAWDVYYSAFNLDLNTGQKSSIEHAERLWQWRFVKLARFGPGSAPDVTFTYLSCTECEPDSMFSSFYYDTEKGAWQMRPWGDGKDLWWTARDGLVVELDLIGDGGGLTFFDCVYGILNSQDAGLQNLAMRCKEFTETASGESKVADNTVIYGISDGQFRARRVTDASEAVRLTQQICKPNMKSFLCRLQGDSSVTAGQNEILKTVFPKAPVTARDLANFSSLNRKMTISEVVSRCGLPDELSGSGFYIFTYHLRDGSYVHLTAASSDGRILEANHLDDKGYGTSLFAAK